MLCIGLNLCVVYRVKTVVYEVKTMRLKVLRTHLSGHGPFGLHLSPIDRVRSVTLGFVHLAGHLVRDKPKPSRPANTQFTSHKTLNI